MAKVKTFRIHPQFGVPDKDIREWLTLCEEQIGFITVNTTFIPGVPGTSQNDTDPRLTVIVTKLDEAVGQSV